jgi:hypothetical protein
VPRAYGPPTPRRFPKKLLVDDGSPYKPDLDAIAATAAKGSLSSRLARAAAQKPELDAQKLESNASPPLQASPPQV